MTGNAVAVGTPATAGVGCKAGKTGGDCDVGEDGCGNVAVTGVHKCCTTARRRHCGSSAQATSAPRPRRRSTTKVLTASC